MKSHILISVLFFNLLLISCSTSKKISDNNQNEIQINNQIWMSKNLSTTQFINGNPIKQAQSDEEWIKAYNNKTPAWCYALDYNDKPTSEILYNYYALIDKRQICPKGWRIPNDSDWNTLINNLGGSEKAFYEFQKETNVFNASFFGYRLPMNWNKTDNNGNIINGQTAFLGESVWWISSGNYLMLAIDDVGSLIMTEEPQIQGGYAIRCIKE
jgi:uncharacterized protein (TIGR02145 family)